MASSTQPELDNPTPVVIWDQEDGDDADSTKGNGEEQPDKADDRLSVERDQTDDTRSSTAGSTYAGSHDELLYNQQVLDAIFQHIPIGVVLITAWGVVRGFSKAASRMFLFSSWEVIGENVQIITPGHVAKRHDYYLSRARQRISARLATIMGRHESNIALDNLLIDSPEQQAKVNHDVARITLFGGQKREVIGVDKTGAPFPVEVTVSPLMMKGQLFFLGYLVDIRDLTSFQDLTVKQELLLRSILDSNTMVRILAGERNIKDTFAVVSLAYVEIVDFPQKVVNLNDDNLVATFLSEIFSMFDKAVISSSAGTKIKTMGSLYLVGTGMPTPTPTDAEQLISLCVMMMQSLYGYNSRVKAGQSVEALLHTVANTQRSKKVRIKDSNNWRKKITPVEARVGIHTGHLVAGMFAQLKGSYDVYGTTVVKADRVRKTGKPMHIHITQETYSSLPAQMQASFQSRKTELGVFGPLETYETLVLPPKPVKETNQRDA